MTSSRPHSRRGRLWTELLLGLLLTALFGYFFLRRAVGEGGILELAPHEVAVRLDLVSGQERVLDAPGTHAFVPWKQEVHRLDRRPLEYVFEGNEHASLELGPRVILRARDGSCYGFPRIVLQVALDPSLAPLALRDLGPEADVRPLLGPMVRSSLREAFGVFTVEEVLDPVNRQTAFEEARESLARRLARHGYALLELTPSQPSFSPKYEETIARRQVAEQDTARKNRDAQGILDGIEDRSAQLHRQRELAFRTRERELAAELSRARRDAEHARAKREAKHRSELAELERNSATALAQIQLQEARVQFEIDALRAHAAALEEHGDRVVREAWVEKLASVEFEFERAPIIEAANAEKD